MGGGTVGGFCAKADGNTESAKLKIPSRSLIGLPLLTNDQNLETIRDIAPSTSSTGRSRSRLRDRNIHIMSFLVERDRAGTACGRDVLEDFPLTSHLMHDGQRAVPVGTDGISSRWIESNTIGPLADSGSGQNFSCIRVG